MPKRPNPKEGQSTDFDAVLAARKGDTDGDQHFNEASDRVFLFDFVHFLFLTIVFRTEVTVTFKVTVTYSETIFQ